MLLKVGLKLGSGVFAKLAPEMGDVFVATLVKVVTGATVACKQAALFEVAHIGSGHCEMVSQHLGPDQTGTALLSS